MIVNMNTFLLLLNYKNKISMTDGHSSANAILQSLGKKTWYHFRFIQSLFSALDSKWYVISFGYSDIQADSKEKTQKNLKYLWILWVWRWPAGFSALLTNYKERNFEFITNSNWPLRHVGFKMKNFSSFLGFSVLHIYFQVLTLLFQSTYFTYFTCKRLVIWTLLV